MADVKFSELPAATSAGGTDIMAIVQGGVSKKLTLLLLKAFALGNSFVSFVGATVARTYTLPDADATLATHAGTETLSNKTLPAPIITGFTETTKVFSAGSSFTINLAEGTIFRCPTNANATVTLPASAAGKSFEVRMEYGGAHTVTFSISGGGSVRWTNNAAPTPTSVNGKIDSYVFRQDGTNTIGSDGGRNI